MSELVRQIQLGDITFGAPKDIELLHTPWGYYKFLGVSTDASRDEIDEAYKKLAKKLHPDAGGTNDSFKTLNHVVEILLDEGGELGQEHSQRRHYDEVCSLDYHFDGFIEHKGERTRKLSEIMLIQLQLKKRSAEFDHEVEQQFPEYKELQDQLKRARSDESKERIAEEIAKVQLRAKGLPEEKLDEIKRLMEERQEQHQKQARAFVQSFRDSPNTYFAKILDVFYVGGENVTFGDECQRLCIAAHEEKKHVLELILFGDCYIKGFSKVHFKAPQANVTIQDPNVEGLFHVVEGNVTVNYPASTYGSVIRARAPKVNNLGGFVEKDGLFVPERFATGRWYEKKPAVDIAVRNGSVTLQLTSPNIISSKYILSESNLENFIEKYSNINDIYNKKESKFRKKEFF